MGCVDGMWKCKMKQKCRWLEGEAKGSGIGEGRGSSDVEV